MLRGPFEGGRRAGDDEPGVTTLHIEAETIAGAAAGDEQATLFRAFNALSAHVALLDAGGRIRWVNDAWTRFGTENGGDPGWTFEGVDYASVCRSTLPSTQIAGTYEALQRVLEGRSRSETLEYPCHAPEKERWFRACFERISDHGELQVVVVHENVTDSVLAARSGRETARLTRQLQTSLLGHPTPSIDYDVSTSYRPGDSRLLLGGDFLDVVATPAGRLAAVIGDVAGHSPEAAALGTTLRAGWRTLALSGVGPATVLERLDAVLRSERRDDELFATIAGIWIEPGGTEGVCALAGHPPPLVVGSFRADPVAAPTNPPLGCLAREAATARFTLPANHSLLLYTDGLTDARARPGGSERLGIDGLGRLAAPLDLRAGGSLERLLASVMAAAGEGLKDDGALVAITHARTRPIR